MELWKRLAEFVTGIPRDYLIDRDYRAASELQNHFYLPVEILTGRWRGVKFSYENVVWNKVVASIVIDDGAAIPSTERMVATYNVDVITEGPKSTQAKHSERFKAVADEIWVDYSKFIVDNHNKIRQQVLADDNGDEDGTTDFEESLNPRGVRKKGTSSPVARVRSKQKRRSGIASGDGLHSSVQPVSHGSDS